MADGKFVNAQSNQPLSDAETTHDSLNLEQLDNQRGPGNYNNGSGTTSRGGGGGYIQSPPMYETETLSKRDYYTARRNTNNDVLSGAVVHASANEPVKGNMARCEVIMLDGTAERFDIDRNANGLELFNAVCSNLDLMEKDYFGITYRDSTTDQWFWLNWEKKIGKQVGTGRTPWKFEFQVKFYPPDPENLKEDLTRYYLCLQVRQDIISSKLPCSFVTYVLLGSYVVQSEMGDFDIDEHRHPDYIQDMPFCPPEYHTVELLDRINEMHKQHKGQNPELADLNFLDNSKKLAMYGVDLHQARDSNGEDVFVGVYYGGVLVYRDKLRINRFSWPKIIKISYKRAVFRIAVRPNEGEREEKIIEFKCANHKLAKRLWRAVVDHHGFFRLKNPEKPKRPTLMPGKHRATYSGPTRSQADEVNANRHKTVHRAPTVRHHNNANQNLTNADADANWGELPTLPMDKKKKPIAATDAQYQRTVDTVTDIRSEISTSKPATLPQQWARRPDLLNAPEFKDRWRFSPADSTTFMEFPQECMSTLAPPKTGWQGSRANKGVRGPGQFYFEATVANEGPGRLGWSTQEASLELASDQHGYGYGADPKGFGRNHKGRKMHGNTAEDYGQEWRLGDVLGCYIDLGNGMIQWSVNGKELGPAYHVTQADLGETFYPAACLKDGSKLDYNFGDDPRKPLLYAPHQDEWTPVGLATAPANCASNPLDWRLNLHDATGAMETSPDGHTAQSRSGHGWQGQRSNQGVKNHGRYYFEGSPKEPGLSRVGWSTERGDLVLGTDVQGFGYGADQDGFGINNDQGKKLHNGEIENYGQSYGPGDVVGCFVDLDKGVVQWSKNGTQLGTAFEIPSGLRNEAFFPTLCLKDSTMELNFGEQPFKFYPGDGWSPVCRAPSDCRQQTSHRGVDPRKSKGFSYADPRLLQETLHKRNSSRQSKELTSRSSISQNPAATAPTNSTEHPEQTVNVNGLQQVVIQNKHTVCHGEDKTAEPGEVWGPHGVPLGVGPPHDIYAPVPPLDSVCRDHQHLHDHEKTRTIKSEEYGEPEVELITHTDEHGNTITKKITKIKKTTRTQVIRTVEGRCGEVTSNSVDHPEPSITNSVKRTIVVSGKVGDEDDGFDFDQALDAAIYGEAGFDPAACVQDESVKDFSMSTNKGAESDI